MSLRQPGKLISEKPNSVSDKILELKQCYDNKLTLPLSNLPERYLRGDLTLLFYGACNLGGHRQGFSACIEQSVLGKFRGNHDAERGKDENQFPMLIDSVHIVDNPKRIIKRVWSAIWLKPLNDVPSTGTSDSLYFSLIHGNLLFLDGFRIKNREFNSVRVGSPVCITGELPCNMIERGTKVVDDLPSEHTEPYRDFPISVIIDSLKEQLVITIVDDWIFTFLKEPGDLGIEIRMLSSALCSFSYAPLKGCGNSTLPVADLGGIVHCR